MNYSYQKPHPVLTGYIQTVLVLEKNSTSKPSDLPLVTNGMNALLCQSEPGIKSQVTLFGESIPDEKWLVEGNKSLIAFFFKPYAMSTIFKLSAQELKNGAIELECWQPQKSIALNLQLSLAQTIPEMVNVLNQFIVIQFHSNQKECDMIQFATNQIMQNPNSEILALLLYELSLTERTFQRIFKKHVGVSPNQYRRLCQFYFAFAQVKGKHFNKLNDVAYTNGYFDQSHFIRSFKEFTDSTPNDYLQFGLNRQNK